MSVEVINKYMKKKKYSVTELAERMNVSIQTIYNWMNGVEPSMKQVVKLGQVLGVSSTTIFKDYANRYKEEVK